MSALDVLNSVFDDLGTTVPNPSVSSTSATQKNIVNFINTEGRALVIRADWPDLVKTVDIDIVGGAFPLPADYSSVTVGGGVFDAVGNGFISVADPSLWRVLQTLSSLQRYYYIEDGNIFVKSPDSIVETIHLSYVRKYWVDSTAPRDDILYDSDTFRVPEDLLRSGAVWRWNRSKGYDYATLFEEHEASIQTYYRDAKGVA